MSENPVDPESEIELLMQQTCWERLWEEAWERMSEARQRCGISWNPAATSSPWEFQSVNGSSPWLSKGARILSTHVSQPLSRVYSGTGERPVLSVKGRSLEKGRVMLWTLNTNIRWGLDVWPNKRNFDHGPAIFTMSMFPWGKTFQQVNMGPFGGRKIKPVANFVMCWRLEPPPRYFMHSCIQFLKAHADTDSCHVIILPSYHRIIVF